MATIVSLDQAHLVDGLTDVDRNVIVEAVQNDYFFGTLPFHMAAARTGLGSAWTYSYLRETTLATAGFRALGSNYTSQVAEVEEENVKCKVLGGDFTIDRALGAISPEEIAYQMSAKVRAAKAAFTNAVINGDSDGGTNAFDGLSKILTGTSTEVDASAWDWSAVTSTTEALALLGQVDEVVDSVVGDNKVIVGNSKTLAKINQAALMVGYRTASEDAAGRRIKEWNGVPFVDLGNVPSSGSAIVPVTSGASDLYVVSLSNDGFHAVAPSAYPVPVRTWLPEFKGGEVNAKGTVEMVAAVVLKRTNAAAVARDITVSA